jgi:4-hydroxythreonine-4-phosphate dehydrogenase
MSAPPPIALTCGDPAGVGPELIARLLGSDRERLVPIGPAAWIASLPVAGIAVGPEGWRARPGEPEAEGHRLALAAMARAAEGCRRGEFAAVVTGPVSKTGLASVGFRHPGQTEFFAERWGGDPVMAFAGGRMTVALATWHLPLSAVPGALTPGAVTRAAEALDTLLARLGKGRRIGVCGLNPHAGEAGLLGTEDEGVIRPAVGQLAARGLDAHGPIPGDTAFARHLAGEFDGLVAMYHDQGLAPLKAVDFAEAANLTLGLPHLRTSPDHGTAYALAGRGTADGRSLASAVRLARTLAAR